MVNIRRVCALALSLALLTACSGTPAQTDAAPDASAEPWEAADIFLSYATSQKHQEQSISVISGNILQESEGRIYCNAYTSQQMGDDDSLLAAVRSGALSMVQMSTAPQAQIIPELALLDTPHLFDSPEACNQALNGTLLDFFQPFYNREGLQLLSWRCSRFRQLSSSFRVETPADLKRLDIRILDNKYHQLYWTALGAKTEVIPFSDLFYSVQQGVVNAQENPPNALIDLGLFQFQPYLLLTNHVPFISCVVMNKECYDSLSPQDQQLIVGIFQDYYSSVDSGVSMLELSEYFLCVDSPSPALNEAFLQAAGTVKQALREDLGAEVSDSFYALFAPAPEAELPPADEDSSAPPS